MCMIETQLTLEAQRVFNLPKCQKAAPAGESSECLPAVWGKCEQLCQKRCLFLFFSRQDRTLKPSLLICHLDTSDETAALLPTERPHEESGAGLAFSLDKRNFRLRPGPKHTHRRLTENIYFTALA